MQRIARMPVPWQRLLLRRLGEMRRRRLARHARRLRKVPAPLARPPRRRLSVRQRQGMPVPQRVRRRRHGAVRRRRVEDGEGRVSQGVSARTTRRRKCVHGRERRYLLLCWHGMLDFELRLRRVLSHGLCRRRRSEVVLPRTVVWTGLRLIRSSPERERIEASARGRAPTWGSSTQASSATSGGHAGCTLSCLWAIDPICSRGRRSCTRPFADTRA